MLGSIGPIEAPGLAYETNTGPFSLGGVLGAGTELLLFGEVPSKCTRISS
jgi:hypothetical protein